MNAYEMKPISSAQETPVAEAYQHDSARTQTGVKVCKKLSELVEEGRT